MSTETVENKHTKETENNPIKKLMMDLLTHELKTMRKELNNDDKSLLQQFEKKIEALNIDTALDHEDTIFHFLQFLSNAKQKNPDKPGLFLKDFIDSGVNLGEAFGKNITPRERITSVNTFFKDTFNIIEKLEKNEYVDVDFGEFFILEKTSVFLTEVRNKLDKDGKPYQAINSIIERIEQHDEKLKQVATKNLEQLFIDLAKTAFKEQLAGTFKYENGLEIENAFKNIFNSSDYKNKAPDDKIFFMQRLFSNIKSELESYTQKSETEKQPASLINSAQKHASKDVKSSTLLAFPLEISEAVEKYIEKEPFSRTKIDLMSQFCENLYSKSYKSGSIKSHLLAELHLSLKFSNQKNSSSAKDTKAELLLNSENLYNNKNNTIKSHIKAVDESHKKIISSLSSNVSLLSETIKSVKENLKKNTSANAQAIAEINSLENFVNDIENDAIVFGNKQHNALKKIVSYLEDEIKNSEPYWFKKFLYNKFGFYKETNETYTAKVSLHAEAKSIGEQQKFPAKSMIGKPTLPLPKDKLKLKDNRHTFTFATGEHKEIGDKVNIQILGKKGNSAAYLNPLPVYYKNNRGKLVQTNDNKLRYSEILADAGDYFASKSKAISDGKTEDAHKNNFIVAYKTLAADETLMKKNQEIFKLDKEAPFKSDTLNLYYQQLAYTAELGFDYLTILKNNYDHFGDDAMAAYKAGHKLALEAAKEANALHTESLKETDPKVKQNKYEEGQKYYFYALSLEAFACHFLSDHFAGGHLRVPRRLLSENYGTLGGALVNSMHEEDGKLGVEVENAHGDKWRCYGDGKYNDARDKENSQILTKTLQSSMDEVFATYKDGDLTKLPATHITVDKLVPKAIDNQKHQPLIKEDTKNPGKLLIRSNLEDSTSTDYQPLTRIRMLEDTVRLRLLGETPDENNNNDKGEGSSANQMKMK